MAAATARGSASAFNNAQQKQDDKAQGHAPKNHGQAPNYHGQAPNYHGQAPNNYGQAPNNHGQGPQYQGQGPQNHGQAPNNQGQAPKNDGLAELAQLAASGNLKVVDLALYVWNGNGNMAKLVHEMADVYHYLSPPTLTTTQSNKICNSLALIQGVATHPQTRVEFVNSQIPLLLFPFLETKLETGPYEYLRLASLGVLVAMIRDGLPEAVVLLLQNDYIQMGLRLMEFGHECQRTMATFILQKILKDPAGLGYICDSYERFSMVAIALGKLVVFLAIRRSPHLYRQVIRCYLRLKDDERARQALSVCLPEQLKDSTFEDLLGNDMATRHWLGVLLAGI